MIFPVAELGGAENVFLNLIRFRTDPALSYEAILLAEQDGGLGAELTRLGVPWQIHPRGRMASPLALLRVLNFLRRHLRQCPSDILFTNSPQGYLYGRWASLGRNRRSALYYMSVPQPRLLANHPFDILLKLQRPDHVFTASNTIANAVRNWGLASVSTVYHGTPAEAPSADALAQVASQLAERGVGPDAPVLVLPGRLQPWKGQLTLVEAMPSILRAVPHAHAVLLGGTMFGRDASFPAVLQRRLAELQAANRVHLLGHQPVRGWLQRANAVIHASLQPDAFPNVCIEAMSLRRPLITVSHSGTSEIVRDGVDALVVPPGDADALARAVTRVLRDPAAAQQMGEAGFLCYQNHCTPGHMVALVETKLRQLARN